jgi:hypothetical protein
MVNMGTVTGRELPKQIYTESLSLPHDMKFPDFAAGIVEIMSCLRLQAADESLAVRRGKHVARYRVSGGTARRTVGYFSMTCSLGLICRETLKFCT